MKKDARQDGDRLISGKLRAKPARRGAANAVVAVDGTDYSWAERHGWTIGAKRIKVVSLSVSLRPGRTRELILDLAFRLGAEEGPPSEERVMRALVRGIRSALEAGWDPESRGRAFRYEIAQTA